MSASTELSWGDLSEQPATATSEKQSAATATADSHTTATTATSQPHTAQNATTADSKPAIAASAASTTSDATPAASTSASATTAASTSASAPTTTDDVSDAADQLSKTSVTNTTSQANGKPAAAPSSDDHDDSDESNLHPNDHSAEVQVIGGGASIYKAAESFESLGLSKELLQGVYDMKFTMPSKIQARALPIILDPAHSNLIGQAQHGSGKTAAFCLGLLSRIDIALSEPQAIVVCPTRELANQVADVAKALSKYTTITIQTVVPAAKDTSAPSVQPTVTDATTKAESRQLTGQVLIGTPGSLQQRVTNWLTQLRRENKQPRIKVFVADEADQMVSSADNLGSQTIAIKKLVTTRKQAGAHQKGAGSEDGPQVLLFSATFDGKTAAFAKQVAPSAVEIRIKTEELSLDGIKQFYVDCPSAEEKYKALSSIFSLLEIGATIIFVQTVATAKWLTNQMRSDGYTVSLLHGKDMPPQERDKVMSDFRHNKTNVLITTNVLARGIDVLSVTLVINYDVPVTRNHQPDTSTYIHRIGRSGRFGRKGVAINFIHDAMSRRLLSEITQHFGKQLDVDMVKLPVNDIEKASEIVQKALGKV